MASNDSERSSRDSFTCVCHKDCSIRSEAQKCSCGEYKLILKKKKKSIYFTYNLFSEISMIKFLTVYFILI